MKGLARPTPLPRLKKTVWAKLFEYIGSEEHVRLRFSIDRIGASLNDAVIIYEDSSNGGRMEQVPIEP